MKSGRGDTADDAAFVSGAALSHLHGLLAHKAVPRDLLRARLALRAAEICVVHAGRPERAADLRDAVHFLQPGDQPGPAGEVYLAWMRAAARPLSAASLHRALPALAADRIADWFGRGQGGPVARAAAVLSAVGDDLTDDGTALLLADAALAQALGWSHLVPLLARGLKRHDLRKSGDALRLACHRAIGVAAQETAREATALSRAAARLHEVAPKLRAKGAEKAVALFLTQDAAAPTALVSLRSDRAARRFCDRLVSLGAARELTGRDTFRLYGI